MLKINHPQIILLIETKLNARRIENVRISWGFHNGINVSTNGTIRCLYLAWIGDVTIQLSSFSTNHIDIEISEKGDSQKW